MALAVVLGVAAAAFGAAGALIVFTVARYADFLLHEDAFLLVGGAFIASAVGTAGLSVPASGAQGVLPHVLLVVAGVGHCLAGWKFVRQSTASAGVVDVQVSERAPAGGFEDAP